MYLRKGSQDRFCQGLCSWFTMPLGKLGKVWADTVLCQVTQLGELEHQLNFGPHRSLLPGLFVQWPKCTNLRLIDPWESGWQSQKREKLYWSDLLLPFLFSKIWQPIAFLAVWEQQRYCPSIQKHGWYFCTRSLLYRITVTGEKTDHIWQVGKSTICMFSSLSLVVNFKQLHILLLPWREADNRASWLTSLAPESCAVIFSGQPWWLSPDQHDKNSWCLQSPEQKHSIYVFPVVITIFL